MSKKEKKRNERRKKRGELKACVFATGSERARVQWGKKRKRKRNETFYFTAKVQSLYKEYKEIEVAE